MKSILRPLLVSALLLGLTHRVAAASEVYKIDPVHSNLSFTIRHFVSKVKGTFTKVTGTLTLDRDNLENSSADVAIDVASLNTANDARDKHVKSPDFFDVANYATSTFKSTSWKKTGESTYDITGDLTVKGVTKPVVLKATLLGFGDGSKGAKLTGWEATTTLKKSDFGVNGPATLSAVVGDDVTISIEIEADLVK